MSQAQKEMYFPEDYGITISKEKAEIIRQIKNANDLLGFLHLKLKESQKEDSMSDILRDSLQAHAENNGV